MVPQCIQVGVVPRLAERQTSDEAAGEVYGPEIDCLLAILVPALVFGCRSSNALADA